MKCKFNVNDLRQRLDASIVRYKGLPVWVRVEGSVLYLYDLATAGGNGRGKPLAIPHDDPELDVSTVPLGYLNTKTDAVYLAREPARRYKQGIDEQSLTAVSADGSKRVAYSLLSKQFEDVVNDKYPPLEDVVKNLRSGSCNSQAFNRNIALSIDSLGIIRVYYKTNLVGWIPPNEMKVNVPTSEVAWIVSRFLDGFDWVVD